ncbi:lipase 3-like [Epargyreus clarus]|uniref:lipase 3-like n=1 Tax=Epargyreus clarus TaxID=520877 RepID=UPI003C2C1B19
MNFRCALTIQFVIIFCFRSGDTSKLQDHDTAVRKALAVINFDTLQFLKKYNYEAERHKVVTEDGYILNIFRIPRKGPPVMLVHGIGDSSDSWLVLGPKNSLACLLADAGYDVWMFNSRGNKYSKTHVRDLSNKELFDFTFEEMGTQDLPATIDYILKRTSRKKLTYIGFSQGTTIFFIMCSLRPEYNDKINHAILLAPVAWINHTKFALIEFFTEILDGLTAFSEGAGLYEVFAANHLLNLYHVKVCNVNSVLRFLCEIEYYLNYGIREITNLPSAKLPTLASHIPAGLSAKSLFHFLQNYKNKRFQRFDNGKLKNQMLYNSDRPPEYDVSRIKTPLTLMMSESDWFSNVEDVEYLRRKLKSVDNFIVINKTVDFTHIEFVYGSRVNVIVNRPVISLLQRLHL